MAKYRIACHEMRPASLVDVEYRMSTDDVLEALMVLAGIDEARKGAE